MTCLYSQLGLLRKYERLFKGYGAAASTSEIALLAMHDSCVGSDGIDHCGALTSQMRITQIGNACCVYESNHFRLLADPWLKEGAFEGSWFHYPLLRTRVADLLPIDAIYISHLHPDHFDEETLRKFPKTTPILYLDQPPNFLEKKLKALGFEELFPIGHQETQILGPYRVTMYKPFTGHLFHETQIGNLIDSALVIEDEEFRILNANDNAPTLAASVELYDRHGAFDVVQLVDSCAGPYPACFENLSHEEKLKEKERILLRHLKLMADSANLLRTRYFQPFAGHYQLGGRLLKLNPYLAVAEVEEVSQFMEKRGLRSLALREGDTFDLTTSIIHQKLTHTFDRKTWENDVRNAPYTYDHWSSPSRTDLYASFMKALIRLREKQRVMDLYPNWKVVIEVRDPNERWEFDLSLNPLTRSEKTLTFSLPAKLMMAILKKEIHWNNAEVGCHIQMHREPNEYCYDIHMLMCFFHE